MKWFRMAGGMVTGVLAFANAPSAQGGNPDPIAVKQEKAEKSSKFEGRWPRDREEWRRVLQSHPSVPPVALASGAARH